VEERLQRSKINPSIFFDGRKGKADGAKNEADGRGKATEHRKRDESSDEIARRIEDALKIPRQSDNGRRFQRRTLESQVGV
jgi:hypothetical protein